MDDEKDQLWELLGKAQERKASPFFANKVMHAIRREEREPERVSVWMRLRRWWYIPVTAGACATIAVLSLMQDPVAPSAPPQQVAKVDPLAEMVTVLADSEELDSASLPDLLATEDNSVWLAADPSSLF